VTTAAHRMLRDTLSGKRSAMRGDASATPSDRLASNGGGRRAAGVAAAFRDGTPVTVVHLIGRATPARAACRRGRWAGAVRDRSGRADGGRHASLRAPARSPGCSSRWDAAGGRPDGRRKPRLLRLSQPAAGRGSISWSTTASSTGRASTGKAAPTTPTTRSGGRSSAAPPSRPCPGWPPCRWCCTRTTGIPAWP
jgi:hypothetical protein